MPMAGFPAPFALAGVVVCFILAAAGLTVPLGSSVPPRVVFEFWNLGDLDLLENWFLAIQNKRVVSLLWQPPFSFCK